jgi:hypothetical protein
VIYFPNSSRFDGIFLTYNIIGNRPEWGLKPLMRNGEVYKFELRVYGLKFVFRDSMKLLPGSLRMLGDNALSWIKRRSGS